MDLYWTRKCEIASEISTKNGFREYNIDFWRKQTAGVISLLLRASKRSIYLCDVCFDRGDWDGSCDCLELEK